MSRGDVTDTHRKVDLYSTYSHFEAEALARIRVHTFGEDFGQNSWTTADEYRRWAERLALDAGAHVLEVASGSGGPAIFLVGLCGCRVTGVDINEHGIAAAVQRAAAQGVGERVTFRRADANETLPFADRSFDAVVCVDSANHFPHRLDVLRDWHRVLRPGGKVLFTDPVVVTGVVSSEELAIRSVVGFFLFAPPGANEALIDQAGLELIGTEDVTANAALVSERWHDARAADRDALIRIEGEERFEGLQRFFAAVHRLTSERRLSRIATWRAGRRRDRGASKMAIRVVRLGSPRARGEGLRLGTVRRPPRGVPKSEYAARDFYDVWLPDLAPSEALLKQGQGATDDRAWRTFERRYRAEMKRPEAVRLLTLLAALSRQTDFSVACYCADESRCHRSLLKELLKEHGAELA